MAMIPTRSTSGAGKRSFVSWLTVALLLHTSGARVGAATAPLIAEPAIPVPGSKGGFDFLEVDSAQRRLLADHTGNGTLDVFDLDSGKLLKQVPTGAAQGVAIDRAGGKYFVGVSREQVLVTIDSKNLEISGKVALSGPADAIAFDPKHRRVYVGHDDGKELWMIDPDTQKIVGTIAIAAGPEYVLYDDSSDRLFQNIKSDDTVLAIDPATNTITERWSTAPAKGPHGLALDPKSHRLFSAGNNGKLAVIDSRSGKLVSSVDIAAGVDQIALDADKRCIYCASRTGVISVVEETAEGGAISLGDVKTAPGAKTLAVDPMTHAVWIAYADKDKSYICRLTAP